MTAADDWRAGWDDVAVRRRRDRLATSPAERLRWLEDAIDLAGRVRMARAEKEGARATASREGAHEV